MPPSSVTTPHKGVGSTLKTLSGRGETHEGTGSDQRLGVQLYMSDYQTHVFTCTYTADVSGVCSAMYELGGMTILHDPSG